jgi:UMF1 family MFS transporter
MSPTRESFPPVTRREIFSWAMFDFANSGYTTVVLTAIFNAWFVAGIAGAVFDNGTATLLWTLATSLTNLLVLLSAPVIGAMADLGAHKKRFLAISTAGCVFATLMLAFAGRGEVVFAMIWLVLSAFLFHTSEDLIASFLPEIAGEREIGRISGYGWSLGYFGGLLVLGLCLGYIQWAQARGLPADHFVPATLVITASAFALASLPTFFWLRERAIPVERVSLTIVLRDALARVTDTLRHARRYRDLFRFLFALSLYYCGIYTVIVLAAVYAQQAMGFGTAETVTLILVVNATAAAGAFGFGFFQDRAGSVATLAVTLLIWIAALVLAWFVTTRGGFWVVANLVGLALGSSQSAGRALVGLLSPTARSAEFYGLWGFATKLASVVGPLTYGLIVWLTGGDHRLALLATGIFFVAGLAVLVGVDERRGRQAAILGS